MKTTKVCRIKLVVKFKNKKTVIDTDNKKARKFLIFDLEESTSGNKVKNVLKNTRKMDKK